MYFSILAALLFLGDFLPAEGCSCLSKHLQRSYCAPHNVVLKVKFLSATSIDVPGEYYSLITYKIDLLQVLKGGSDIQNLNEIHTSTEYYCEMFIKPSDFNKEYLVTGPYAGGRVDLIYCDYVVQWSQLTEFQIKGIQGAYAKGCDCEICRSGQCDNANTDSCKFKGEYDYPYYPDETTSPAPEDDNTPLEDKMCARDENGICAWQSVGSLAEGSQC